MKIGIKLLLMVLSNRCDVVNERHLLRFFMKESANPLKVNESWHSTIKVYERCGLGCACASKDGWGRHGDFQYYGIFRTASSALCDKCQGLSYGLYKAMLLCRVGLENSESLPRGEKKKLPQCSQLKSFYSQPIHTENWWVMVDEAQMDQTEVFVCNSEPRYFTVWFCSYSFPGITLHDEPVDWAAAGDHVSLTLTGMDIIKIKWAELSFSLSNGLFLMKSFITITLNNQRFTWRMMWLPGYLKPKWCLSPGSHVQTLETSALSTTAASEEYC